MGTRNFIQAPLSRDVMALNALTYGFAGHSMLTPHYDIKQTWWTDERIAARVDRKFIESMLRGPEKDALESPFGADLSDETYLSWILERSRRLFLILSQINCAPRIFSLTDDFWSDDDLPLSREDVQKLRLSVDNEDLLHRAFYDVQFHYLLRPLSQGTHIDYGPSEHIPMEYAFTLPHAVSLAKWSRVHFPNDQDTIFVRRRFDMQFDASDENPQVAFLEDILKARTFQHKHIARIWASYTSDEKGYILTDFVPVHTLRSFIGHRDPPQFAVLSRIEQTELLLKWMLGLTDAVAYIHSRDECHGRIRPSNILIDRENNIVFSDAGCVATLRTDTKPDKHEGRDYTAPEHKVPFAPDLSSISKKTASSIRPSIDTTARRPSFATCFTRSSTLATSIPQEWSPPPSPTFPLNALSHLYRPLAATLPPSPPPSPTPAHVALPRYEHALFAQQAADIYSLGAIYLDIIAFLVFGKAKLLTKFRAQHPVAPVEAEVFPGNITTIDAPGSAEHFDSFLAVLRKGLYRFPTHHAACIGELISITRSMLTASALRRPSARRVRDMVLATVQLEAAIEDISSLKLSDWESQPITPGGDDSLIRSIERCKKEARDRAAEEEEDLLLTLEDSSSERSSSTSRRGSAISELLSPLRSLFSRRFP